VNKAHHIRRMVSGFHYCAKHAIEDMRDTMEYVPKHKRERLREAMDILGHWMQRVEELPDELLPSHLRKQQNE